MKNKVMIYFTNETDSPVTYGLKMLVRRSVIAALEYEGFYNDAEVSVTFTDNEGIRRINSEFRGIDKPTDVLSFPLTDFEGGDEPPTDEPFISLERAREQAEEFGHSFERECAFLCVHSMLHLLGYDHVNSDEEDAEMRRRQSEILESMGLGVK